MPLPERLLRGTRREYTIGRLVEMTPMDPTMPNERRLLGLVLPPWQRPEVWTVEQKRRFVEGIFLGLGCGYYVTNGLEWVENRADSAPMAGWLLDGQQRISAIRDFLDDNLVVFGDVTFSTLSRPEALRFKREQFPCFEIEYTDNEDVLKELYDRLNFGGTPHTLDQRVVVPCNWRPYEDGHTLGQRGSENGIITLDETHGDDARITIERDGDTAPWSITCGIHGWAMHTRFFSTQDEAQTECEAMKVAIAPILEAIAQNDADGDAHISRLISQFVERFP